MKSIQKKITDKKHLPAQKETLTESFRRSYNNVFGCRSDDSSLADGVPQFGGRDFAPGFGRNPPVRYTTQTLPMAFWQFDVYP